jgi:hypothetical protein
MNHLKYLDALLEAKPIFATVKQVKVDDSEPYTTSSGYDGGLSFIGPMVKYIGKKILVTPSPAPYGKDWYKFWDTETSHAYIFHKKWLDLQNEPEGTPQNLFPPD